MWCGLWDRLQHTKGTTHTPLITFWGFFLLLYLTNIAWCLCPLAFFPHVVFSFCIQASEEPEERETLALMAARGDSEETQDGETYIEKYTRGVLEVENILSLEKLRQVFLYSRLFYTGWYLLCSKLFICCVHVVIHLLIFIFSLEGCDSEGSTFCQGETLKEERQHTKCTACNAYISHHTAQWTV